MNSYTAFSSIAEEEYVYCKDFVVMWSNNPGAPLKHGVLDVLWSIKKNKNKMFCFYQFMTFSNVLVLMGIKAVN